MCQSTRIELHSHSPYSNIRLRDAISTIEELVQTAADLKLQGLAITDHETVAAHVKATQKVRELKEKGKIPSTFKLILGNEIYLVDSLEEVRDNYQSGFTKFPHFLILAKDKSSHEILRTLSSQSWSQSFYTGTMERVPTTKSQLEEAIRNNPNKLIGSSACLGSESSIHILNGDFDKAKSFLKWCSDLFGKGNFFLEMQPAVGGEQRIVNEKLIEFSTELGIDLIITSDVHYARPEDAPIHEAFLKSKESSDREVASFYANTFLHSNQEIYEKLSYIDEAIITQALSNTLKIGEMISDYSLENPTIIPKIELPEFEVKHLFKQGYEEYSYIKLMANSESTQDRYLIHLIEEGFLELLYKPDMSKEGFHKILARIDVELGELWEISKQLNQEMSSYYVTVQSLVNTLWGDECGEDSRTEGSLVGSGRGSASGFLINYILKITQINPLIYGVEMPHWRHLHRSRGDISALDIDLDVEPEKRQLIFKRMRKKFGNDRILQVCTYGTEGSKSAIQTACRGLGYDLEVGQYISSLIPFERGTNFSISECLYGSEDTKPVKEFIREIEKYPLLKETALKIEGLINKRSIHAGGIIISSESFLKTNALMRAPNGDFISQYNLEDSQATGSIKYDILGVSNMSKIRQSIEIMLEEGMIEWRGSLRNTFNEYLHPEKLDLNNPKIYELLGKGQIPDLFQFDTKLAQQSLMETKPTNLIEMAAVNSLMRLMGNGDETPVETFAKYKKDISLWYEEMRKHNLNDEEIKILENHLLHLSGVSDVQEVVMMLVQDEKIANMDMTASNKLRKAIAKKSEKEYEAVRKLFYASGEKIGTRKEMLDYVWNVQIARQKGYGFSILHTIAYSIIGIQNIEIVANYSPIIWHTACLTINSGSTEVEEGTKGKSTNYGKIAAGIANIKSYGTNVELPLINDAKFRFTPDIKNKRIIFGLKGINGIGDDIAHEIIKHRPYTSFDDLYERLYQKKIIAKGQLIKLIKAGSFNEFGSSTEIMKQFLIKEVDVKDKLNGQNLPRIISLGLLDTDDLIKYKHFYNFKSHISKFVHETVAKPKDRIFILDNHSQTFFFNHFSDKSITGWHNNQPLVSEKLFKKEYDEKMEYLNELMKDCEFVRQYNVAQFYEIWNENAQGTKESWEMSAVSYYSSNHELQNVDNTRYGISNFFNLDDKPIVLSENTGKNGRIYKNLQLFNIAGTVLDKNTNSNFITLLTKDGVVTCKMWSGNFSEYNRQIKTDGKIVSKSWFSRGNLLLLSGYRRGDVFHVKSEKNQSPIQLITDIRGDGSIGVQSGR